MPSDQLIEAIELYDDHERDKDPSGRIEACQKMGATKEPEAIEALSIIFREDPDEKVKAAAADALRGFRQMQQERQNKDSKSVTGDVAREKSGGGGSKGAARFLTLTLILLIAANAGVFFMKNSAAKENEDAGPTRIDVINTARNTHNAIMADAQGLQEELNKIGQLEDRPNCSRNFNRPQIPQLSEEEVTLYPDLVGLFDPVNSDLAFSLQALDLGLRFWDESCSLGQFDTDAVSSISGRLQVAVDTSTTALGALDVLATPPPATPDPDDVLPVVRDRGTILAEIRSSLNAIISDVGVLQEEFTKIEQGTQPDCNRALTRPQLIVLTQEEATAFPELVPLVDPVNSDLAFALSGLDIGLQAWDSGCQAGQFDAGNATLTIGRLQTALSTAMMTLTSLP